MKKQELGKVFHSLASQSYKKDTVLFIFYRLLGFNIECAFLTQIKH